MAYSEKENLAKVAAGYKGGDWFTKPMNPPKMTITPPKTNAGIAVSNQASKGWK